MAFLRSKNRETEHGRLLVSEQRLLGASRAFTGGSGLQERETCCSLEDTGPFVVGPFWGVDISPFWEGRGE